MTKPVLLEQWPRTHHARTLPARLGVSLFRTWPPTGNAGIFSVQVESSAPLVGVCNIWSPTKYGEYSDYNAYTSGTTLAYAPSLLNQYYGYVSALTVQNIDTADATIKVTYSNGTVETKTLAPRTSVEYYQPNNPNLPSGNAAGIFSAKVESTNGRSIVVLVPGRQNGSAAPKRAHQAATTVNAPSCRSLLRLVSAGRPERWAAPAYSTRTYSTPTRTANRPPTPGNTAKGLRRRSATTAAGPPKVPATAARVTVNENSDDRYAQAPGDYLLAYTAVPAP